LRGSEQLIEVKLVSVGISLAAERLISVGEWILIFLLLQMYVGNAGVENQKIAACGSSYRIYIHRNIAGEIDPVGAAAGCDLFSFSERKTRTAKRPPEPLKVTDRR